MGLCDDGKLLPAEPAAWMEKSGQDLHVWVHAWMLFPRETCESRHRQNKRFANQISWLHCRLLYINQKVVGIMKNLIE